MFSSTKHKNNEYFESISSILFDITHIIQCKNDELNKKVKLFLNLNGTEAILVVDKVGDYPENIICELLIHHESEPFYGRGLKLPTACRILNKYKGIKDFNVGEFNWLGGIIE